MEMIWAFQASMPVEMIWFVGNLFNIRFARVQIHVSSRPKKIFDDQRIIFSSIYGKEVLWTRTHYSAFIFWSFVCIFFSPPFCAESLSKYYIDDILGPKPLLIIFILHIQRSSYRMSSYMPLWFDKKSVSGFRVSFMVLFAMRIHKSNGFVESKTRKHYTCVCTVPKQRGAFSLRMKNDE